MLFLLLLTTSASTCLQTSRNLGPTFLATPVGYQRRFYLIAGHYPPFRYRVESRIADAICKNSNLLKVGLRFEFTEVMDRVQSHLIKNIDRVRKDRVKGGGGDKAKEWKPARTLD